MIIEIHKNEVLLRDQEQWLYFCNPYKIKIAESLEEVIPLLSEVEQLVEENGWSAAGFLSYESASAFDSVFPAKPTMGFPYLWFGLYPQPQSVEIPRPEQFKEQFNWQPTIDRDSYSTAIEKIKEYIAGGKTYQVNFTMRLQADFHASAWNFFLHLAESQNKHAAYIDTGRYAICSASPELFFQLDGPTITCRPMKGTVQRGRTTDEDQKQSDWLKNSEKNRAENVMIVDMIRNDMGRIAKIGSVEVPELFSLERYPSLWQMTSTIIAETDTSLTNIFRAVFPSASITGAPKVRTMKIIHEMESTPRKIYTGSIGYISPKRKATFNVAIRTVLIDREMQKAEYGVGGGIVWDSTSADEYQEALLKARVLTESQSEFSLLETMLWSPQDGFFLVSKHMERLLDSAHYFDFPIHKVVIEQRLNEISSTFTSPQRIRLLVDRIGNINIESSPFDVTQKLISAHLAKDPVDSNNVFLFHKTTQRDVYENARADFPDFDDVLLYNDRGELTEFTIGNLVLELDGQLLTPPIDCSLLAGTFRAHLVETGQVLERVMPVKRIKECAKIFRVNSLRKWELVQIQWE